MKAKTVVALLAVVVVARGICFASDQKPYKGWAEEISATSMTIDEAKSYEYLNQVIADRGIPVLMRFATYRGINNVGGETIHENAQIFYFNSTFTAFDFYEDSIITVANGDKIFLTVVGVTTFSGMGSATDTVVGGTGRFDGCLGLIMVAASFDESGSTVVVFDGQITTVGKAKK